MATRDDWAIFDMDDTLSDAGHRAHFLSKEAGAKPDWTAFYNACDQDPARPELLAMALSLSQAGVRIAIMTGRLERHRGLTLDWLSERGITPCLSRFRPDAVFTADFELKKEWAKELMDSGGRVLCAFDDRARNLGAFRALGIHSADATDLDQCQALTEIALGRALSARALQVSPAKRRPR